MTTSKLDIDNRKAAQQLGIPQVLKSKVQVKTLTITADLESSLSFITINIKHQNCV